LRAAGAASGSARDIGCSDEEETRRLAKVVVDDPVELWQAGRFIERFEPK
jgi:hypothetical protein